jgi:hypothetical protein
MLLTRNVGDIKASFSPEQNQQFLKACEIYIENLKKNNNLISAQPLVREGKMILGTSGSWKDGPYTDTNEIIVGYYHILANDLEDAISIAKGNPEFAYTKDAKIEVRPIKVKEETTNYIYLKG